MSAVAAIISPRSPLATAALERMVVALEHRGPDTNGTRSLDPCHLGHTRLSVLDPTGGVQPMSDPSGRFHISFDGEIYNFRELRRELERAGVSFLTRSDTETLLLAYRQWGDAVVQRLNGQFAFVIWDAVEQRLFAARDRLGEKPLYFAETFRRRSATCLGNQGHFGDGDDSAGARSAIHRCVSRTELRSAVRHDL